MQAKLFVRTIKIITLPYSLCSVRLTRL